MRIVHKMLDNKLDRGVDTLYMPTGEMTIIEIVPLFEYTEGVEYRLLKFNRQEGNTWGLSDARVVTDDVASRIVFECTPDDSSQNIAVQVVVERDVPRWTGWQPWNSNLPLPPTEVKRHHFPLLLSTRPAIDDYIAKLRGELV